MRFIYLGVLLITITLQACGQNPSYKEFDTLDKIVKTEQEWADILTEDQYYITREKGTERAYTGKYWNNKEAGVYVCVACGLPLFSSETKRVGPVTTNQLRLYMF